MYRYVHTEKKTGRRIWSEKCLMYRYVHTEKKTGRRIWSKNVLCTDMFTQKRNEA